MAQCKQRFFSETQLRRWIRTWLACEISDTTHCNLGCLVMDLPRRSRSINDAFSMPTDLLLRIIPVPDPRAHSLRDPDPNPGGNANDKQRNQNLNPQLLARIQPSQRPTPALALQLPRPLLYRMACRPHAIILLPAPWRAVDHARWLQRAPVALAAGVCRLQINVIAVAAHVGRRRVAQLLERGARRRVRVKGRARVRRGPVVLVLDDRRLGLREGWGGGCAVGRRHGQGEVGSGWGLGSGDFERGAEFLFLVSHFWKFCPERRV